MRQAIKIIQYSSHFMRAMKRVPLALLDEVREGEQTFRKNCFDPHLRTHKLQGRHQGLWSFSITHKHRIIFRFLAPDIVYFIDVGDHSLYQ